MADKPLTYAFVTDGKEVKVIRQVDVAAAEAKGWTVTKSKPTGDAAMTAVKDLPNIAGDEFGPPEFLDEKGNSVKTPKVDAAVEAPKAPSRPKGSTKAAPAASNSSVDALTEQVMSNPAAKPAANTSKFSAGQKIQYTGTGGSQTGTVTEILADGKLKIARSDGKTVRIAPNDSITIVQDAPAAPASPPITSSRGKKYVEDRVAQERAKKAAAEKEAARLERQASAERIKAGFKAKTAPPTTEQLAAQLQEQGITPKVTTAPSIKAFPGLNKYIDQIKNARAAGDEALAQRITGELQDFLDGKIDSSTVATRGKAEQALRASMQKLRAAGIEGVNDPTAPKPPQRGTLAEPGSSPKMSAFEKEFQDVSDPRLGPDPRARTMAGDKLNSIIGGKVDFDPKSWDYYHQGLNNYRTTARTADELTKLGWSDDQIRLARTTSAAQMQALNQEFKMAKAAGDFTGGMTEFLETKGLIRPQSALSPVEQMVAQINPTSTRPVAPQQVASAAAAQTPLQRMMQQQGARIGAPVNPAAQLADEIASPVMQTRPAGIAGGIGANTRARAAGLVDELAGQVAGGSIPSGATGTGGSALGTVAGTVADDASAAAANSGLFARLGGTRSGALAKSILGKGFGTKANVAALLGALGYSQFGSPLVNQAFDTMNDPAGFGRADIGQGLDTGISSGFATIPIGAMIGAGAGIGGPWGAAAGAGLAGIMGLMSALGGQGENPVEKLSKSTDTLLQQGLQTGIITGEDAGYYQAAVEFAKSLPDDATRQQYLMQIQNEILSQMMPNRMKEDPFMEQYKQLVQQRASTVNATALAMQKMLAEQAAVYGNQMRQADDIRYNYINQRLADPTIDPAYKQLMGDYNAYARANTEADIARLGPVSQAQSYLYYLDQAAGQPSADELLVQQLMSQVDPTAYGLVPASYSAPNGVQYGRPSRTTTSLLDMGLGG